MKKLMTIVALLTSTTLSAQTFTTDTADAEMPIQTELIKEEIKTVNEHKDFFRLATGILGFLVPVAYWTGKNYDMRNRR
jgi:hypothetical protein